MESILLDEKREVLVKVREATSEYFFTVTFKQERRNTINVKKHVWYALQDYGINKAFIAVEPHDTGMLHCHGLMATSGMGGKVPAKLVWTGLHRRFGRSKVELARSQAHVSSYCSKYITKDMDKRLFDYGYYGNKYAWRW